MLVGIVGALGSGKTALLTYLLMLLKLKNTVVWTNYKVTFADLVKSGEELLLDLEEQQEREDFLKSKIALGIDELGRLLKAINFMSTSNDILDDIITMSRKANTDILYTSQHEKMVDRQVRRITDIYIEVDYDDITKIVDFTVSEKKKREWLELDSSIYIEPIFKYYNTYEIIKPDKEAIVNRLYQKAKLNLVLKQELKRAKHKADKLELVKYYLDVSTPMAKILLIKLS